MTRIRPQSLSGLLSAALLLIVLPLTAALIYGGVQLRHLSRTGDRLERDSITLTQHTQRLYQHHRHGALGERLQHPQRPARRQRIQPELRRLQRHP
jgi:hypothetical protein